MVAWGPGACRLYVYLLVPLHQNKKTRKHGRGSYSIAADPPNVPCCFAVAVGGSVRRHRIGTGVCTLALAADLSCTALLCRVAEIRTDDDARAGAGEGARLAGSHRGL